jgi:hypothetical protein
MRQKSLAQDAADEHCVSDSGIYNPDELFNVLNTTLDSSDDTTLTNSSSTRTSLSSSPIQPFMFSFNSSDIFGNKATFQVENSKWSKAMSIETAGTTCDFDLGCQDSNLAYSFGLAIHLGPGRFQRTKVIVIAPRFLLFNQSSDHIFIVQDKTSLIEEDETMKVQSSSVSLPAIPMLPTEPTVDRTSAQPNLREWGYTRLSVDKTLPWHFPERKKVGRYYPIFHHLLIFCSSNSK